MTTPAAAIRCVVFDVDGVFTDGRFTYDEDGRESKTFHTQDGYGIRSLLQAGFEVGVITGRRGGAVSARMAELGVRHVVQGCREKLPVLEQMLTSLDIRPEHCAYVGDDIPDSHAMQFVGLAIAVANAVPEIKAIAARTTERSGGYGAVREICDWLLAERATS